VFWGVAAQSRNDVWAVGEEGMPPRPLIEHYDGRVWKVARIEPVRSGGTFSGVAAVSATNVWAVGDANGHPLVEHWDCKRWLIVKTPPAPTALDAVSASSSDDVWAIGQVYSGFLLHWDGRSWKRSNYGTLHKGSLDAIAAIDRGDAWGVGDNSVTKHWNGTSWIRTPSPSPDRIPFLFAVAALTRDDVWAVGASGHAGVAIHWDGRRWKEVDAGGFAVMLHGLAAIARDDVWAVGDVDVQVAGSVVEHWNGHVWSLVDTPRILQKQDHLALAAAGHDDVWAVSSVIAHFGCAH
jgi:hypothetical protein